MSSSTGPGHAEAVAPLGLIGAAAVSSDGQADEHGRAVKLSASRRTRRYQGAVVGVVFILPTFVFAGVFMYFPVVSALWHSLFNWDGIGTGTFIGLHNFVTMAGDPVMRAAVVNVVKLAVFAMIVSVAVPLPVALLITGLRRPRAQYVWRVLFVIPLVLPNVVIYLLWLFLYDPNFGPLDKFLGLLHLPQPGWLGDPTTALYSLMGIGFPWVQGFALLIFIAGIQAIPEELIDAARVDGAGFWAKLRRVQLPMLMGQIRLVLVLNMIWTIQDYTAVFILTQGGPLTSTMVPGMYLYQNAFQDQNFGYAAAIGVVMFLITGGLTFLNLRFVRPAVDYSRKEPT